MEKINLFMNNHTFYNLTVGKGNKMNTTIYNDIIQLVKGIDNKIQFSIRDFDRVSLSFNNTKDIFMVIIDKNKKTIIEKQLVFDESTLDKYFVIFTENEMLDIDENKFYQASFYMIDKVLDVNSIKEVLYTANDTRTFFPIKIVDDYFHIFKEPIVLNPKEFSHIYELDKVTGMRYEIHTSSNIKPEINGNHTSIITAKNFVGTVKLQGNLEEIPNQGTDTWATLSEHTFTETDYTEETQEITIPIIVENMKTQWLRFQYTYTNTNSGELTEITYQN